MSQAKKDLAAGPGVKPAGRKDVDWEVVETQYRDGRLTLRQMGEEHGISHVSIKKRADKEGWTRDLSRKIKAKAEALVNKDAVNATATKLTEQAVIEANAARIVDIIREQRSDITRARKLATRLLNELEATTENLELFKQLEQILASDERDKLAELIGKVTSLPGRIKGMKELADTLSTLIKLEREAFGIDSRHDPDDGPKLTDDERAARVAGILALARARRQQVSDVTP